MPVFNILKKNRKYFAATKDGYKCKLIIDENSEGLKLGEHLLAVDDISVRSKYGTDFIYKLQASAELQEGVGVCTLKTPYNIEVLEDCRRLGGQWDKAENVWVFPGFVTDEVEALDEKYNSELVTVELTFTKSVMAEVGPITIYGYIIVRAFGRDSGAKLADGVALISGGVWSGGSHKNWHTYIEAGSVIRMALPKLCISATPLEGLEIKTI